MTFRLVLQKDFFLRQILDTGSLEIEVELISGLVNKSWTRDCSRCNKRTHLLL